MEEIGLFPLPLVLMPGEQAPLHIFEPRYRELVAECLDDVARRKVVSIPSRRYRALMLAVRLAPRAAVRAASRRLTSGRH